MVQAKLRVILLESSSKALDLIWRSYRQCYSSQFAPELKDVPNEEKERFIKEMLKRGHHSPLEHVKFTFAIEGISRACSHQLVRHRIASYSQQSQRYVDMSQFRYVVPPSIAKIPEALEEFQRIMEEIRKSYQKIKGILQACGLNGERAKEDTRFLLPQAVETKIIVTMNVRELLHFFSQRLCSRAQWEIRELANKMLEECKKVLPSIFEEVGPKCVGLGYCPEGEKSCGFYLSRKV